MSDVIVNREKFVKGWHSGLPETPCGWGSKLANTKMQREWIPQIIEKYGIKSIADIGAGDMNWISRMDLSGIEYSAYDLVPRADGVIQFDIVNQTAPKVDMLMCLWVLNHIPKVIVLQDIISGESAKRGNFIHKSSGAFAFLPYPQQSFAIQDSIQEALSLICVRQQSTTKFNYLSISRNEHQHNVKVDIDNILPNMF